MKSRTQKEASEVFGIHGNAVNRIELFVKNNPNTKLEVIGNSFGISPLLLEC
ncbi:hypothetical protein [Candidatus Sarmatiella mevalonica]|uniref:hypothetical protein n=1 Tax=Candidatus Sarmatiella mevalonica TaxID=2770581 RepID=UPI0019215CC5|nr:hypothetical protein [Candidatus Sarmatiella mevalonica]